MHRKFHRKMEEMLSRDVPFVVATVISVRGSAVAKPGAKAIIDEGGRPVFGWVGGGCVESFVCNEARAALQTGAPRIITADLEDELSGVGLPCGGVMEIFIEPVMPRRRLLIFGTGALAREAALMSERLGLAVTLHASQSESPNIEEAGDWSIAKIEDAPVERGSTVIIASGDCKPFFKLSRILEAEPDYVALLTDRADETEPYAQLIECGIKEEDLTGAPLHAGLALGGRSAAERTLGVLAEMLAVERGASTRPLQEIKLHEPVGKIVKREAGATPPHLIIIGHSAITQELAWLALRLGWRVTVDSASATLESYAARVEIIRDDADFSRLPASRETAVVVATHHKGDHQAIERSLGAGAWYVGLIASAHRSEIVRSMLEELLPGGSGLPALRTPCGLDLGATTPAEIALSIMSELLASYHGRTVQPRVVVKESDEPRASH